MVRLYGDYDCSWSSSWRMADRTRLLAMGILPESSTGGRGCGDFALARARKPRLEGPACGLVRGADGYGRARRAGHRIPGIPKIRLGQSARVRKPGRRLVLSRYFPGHRRPRVFAYGSA